MANNIKSITRENCELTTVTDNIGVFKYGGGNGAVSTCTVTFPHDIDYGILHIYHNAVSSRPDYYTSNDERFRLLYKKYITEKDETRYIWDTCYIIKNVKQGEVVVFDRDYTGLADYFRGCYVIY